MTYKLRDYLGITSLFVAIITITITLTIWAVPLFQFSLRYLDVPGRVGMSFETIMENYYILLKYLHLPWIENLSLPDFPVSASGAFHFYEVKRLFYVNYGLLIVSVIGSGFYLHKLKQTAGFWRLRNVFKIAIFVPFILLFIVAIDFDWLFVKFHEIIFNNDDWLFNPSTDPIINVLTQEFFMYSFIYAFSLLELFLVSGYLYFKKKTAY